ncbi:hydrolase or acyltransferase (alpha beta hydrolase superfamily) [Fusarium pseudoanthophilum]|uniref:Hydrolase or acyltransferase (Alpha beta hydrolase superfamily) n=1 Tax=Fusarium pseudoanthophilum TaxID=48495 RepID=A0A8H5KPZ4_9HYPO|nr:hydrolase or acyltransferase (alpha beta hydrolase superfamily) [Fusarium pseudoanthophilum]
MSSGMTPQTSPTVLNAGTASATDKEDPILFLNEDDSFNFDILTGLGQMANDGADVNPVLSVAKKIIPGNFESYINEWFDLANYTKTQALDPKIAYDPINVRATWFSVANYFRRADAYNRADWDDPRINGYWDEQRAAFDKAIAALPVPAERVEIPAGDFNVSGIWYSQPYQNNHTKRLPTLLLTQGFDAAQEDLYATVVAPALARGYNIFSFEGPGQPTVRREQGKSAYVDPEKLVLYGHSFGGYLAARAAAFEPRLTALMLNGGIWDAYTGYAAHLTPELRKLLESGDKEAFDDALGKIQDDPEISTTTKWGILQALWCFKTKSPYEFFQLTKSYNLRGGITDRIQMPVWIADGEFETLQSGQSKPVAEALGDRAELHMFNGTAGYHCQTGAPQEFGRVIFAWLDKILNKH